MAHQVESMFFAGQVPWHGLGTKVESEITAAEAIVKAGLDWEVECQDMFASGDKGFTLSPVEEVRAVVRKKDNAVLGVVGNRYRPIQNRDAFAFFDSIIGEGKAVYHTAGSLNGGRKVWILAKIPGDIFIPGKKDEQIEKYVLLSSSHDGSSTLRMIPTPVRVVCANTLSIAMKNAPAGISVRHTKSADMRIENAKAAIEAASSFYDAFNANVIRLASTKYTEAQMKELVERLFPVSDDEDEISSATLLKREAVSGLFEYGKGHEAIRGTAWAALNAVSEYADHGMKFRGVSGDAAKNRRLDSIWFGAAASLKQRAYDIISSQIS